MDDKDDKFLDQDAFISLVAERARFTRADVKIIYDVIVEIFEEAVQKNIELRLRSLGKLYTSIIPERIGIKGKLYPPAKKIIFRMAENIRSQGKHEEE